ncbi:CehA/McbA family metallohydrolase [Cohnella nanjingensis]|uniref:PHP domain-containing protein n=1 Tax=Cohnella nanjingensis TaxID=1387779 RepID=A0A7X0RPM5_9BACL|nr:CehA/McbA family metallohydrolase [Cohnella nanjingensis]MBB6671342.1 PHP domain-containing protein [Cohnella nanjingensis]
MPHAETIVLRRFIDKTEEKTYPEVPFAVEGDVERIEVRYAYERPDGRTVIDIGLRSPERIVGWSGGARASFFVGLDTATPGYLAGPIPSGQWRVLLGAYRVPDDGCEVEMELTIVREHPRWLKGDLHMHGVHSDGAYEVADAIRSCKDKGLDFVAFTDHNNASQNRATLAADDRLVLIPGVELTSYKGHANLLGRLDALDDFRVLTPDRAAEALRRAQESGALVSLNHPFCPDCPWELGFVVPYDAIEVWNGPWRPLNETAVRWWHEQLVTGRRIVAIGGSDTHAPHPLVAHGMPTTHVRAEAASKAAILDAVRAGRVVLSFAPDETFVDLAIGEAGIGDTRSDDGQTETALSVTVTGAAGDTVRVWSDRGLEREWTVEREGEFVFRVPTDRLFYRAEAYRYLPEWEREILSCLTNPIYMQGGNDRGESTD